MSSVSPKMKSSTAPLKSILKESPLKNNERLRSRDINIISTDRKSSPVKTTPNRTKNTG
jgi:hypothetical protein